MTPELYIRVKALFEIALRTAPEARAGLLLLEPDPEVSSEVKSLLETYEGSTEFLEEPALASRSADIATTPPGRIGAWQIIRQTGEGGMGIVYEAERADGQYQQRAAIKVLKRWIPTESDLARFRAERQILADLDHPNIARLLDGGTTAAGLPWYAMEFIVGSLLDRYCRERELPVAERLRLFRTVCEAVGYAHSKGIIHRDLKPANILVTDSGAPKLLDFGIAKLQAGEGPATQTGNRIATPLYASPEQLQGGAITPSSDIYSLGVILYQILTGTHPCGDVDGAAHEIAAAVCDYDPEPPSKRAGQKTWTKDLDHIVLKAMQKDPSQRFGSAAALSAEIDRYLENQPVQVRAPRFSYQSRRTIRRRWLPALGLFLAGLAATGIWFIRPHAASPRRSVAVLGFQNLSGRTEASWVATALSEMLATELASTERVRIVSSDNVAQVRSDLNVPDAQTYPREVLDRLRASLKVDYFVTGSYLSPSDNALRVYVRLQDAQSGQIVAASTGTGASSQLPSLVNEAVDELLRSADWKDVSKGRTAGALKSYTNPESARLYAEGLERLRRYDTLGAHEVFQKAVAADPKNPIAHSALSGTLAALGYEAKAQEDARLAFDLSSGLPREQRLSIEANYHEALHDWLPAISTCRTLWDLFPDNPEYGLRLARVQDLGGAPKDALATLTVLRTRPGSGQADTGIDLEEAQAALHQSDHARELAAAQRAYRSASRLNARLLMAVALQEQGDALYGLERNEEALAPYRAADLIYRDLGNDFGVASILHREGRLFWKKGDYTGQLEYDRQALDLFEKIGNKSAIPAVLMNLALAKRGRGDPEGALALLQQSIAIERELGQKFALEGSLNNAGSLLRRINRPDEARRYFEECIAIATQLNDRDQIARSHITLKIMDFDEGNLLSAAEHLRQSLAILGGPTDSLLRIAALQHRGDVEKARGELETAKKTCLESLAISERMKADQYSADTKTTLAEITGEQGDLQAAARYLAEARAYYVPLHQKSEQYEAALVEARIGLAHDLTAVEAAAEGYHSIKSAAGEASAYTVLASALLAQHRTREAKTALDKGRTAWLNANDFQAKMRYRLVVARVAAASGRRASAINDLKAMLSDLETKNWSELAVQTRNALTAAGAAH
jgi:serine/threonine protein kinase/tetratricopeptide (TPR) repeat protein